MYCKTLLFLEKIYIYSFAALAVGLLPFGLPGRRPFALLATGPGLEKMLYLSSVMFSGYTLFWLF